MLKLNAKVRLLNEKVIKKAKMNFDDVQDDILSLKFKWNNKRTDIDTFRKYINRYLRDFDGFKGCYEIIDLSLSKEI